MLKKINRLLKIVGLNLVHAKKPKAYAIKGTSTGRKSCVPSPTCCADEYNAKSTGRTYPARSAFTATDGVAGPTQDNNVTGPTS